MELDPSKLKRVNTFAREKNVSVDSVLSGVELGQLTSVKIDTQIFIIDNEISNKWEGLAQKNALSIEKNKDIILFHLGSKLRIYEKANVEKELIHYIETGFFKFIFIFDDNPSIDSSGFGVLTRAALHAVANKSRIQVINMIGEARKNFTLTKLEKVIDFPDNIDIAIKNIT